MPGAGHFSVGPVAALQYTLVHIDGFNERGSLLPLQIHADSQDSLRTDFGVRASYAWHVGGVLLIPSLTAAWEHEYLYSVLPINVGSPLSAGATATLFGPREGHDSAIINGGIGAPCRKTIAFGRPFRASSWWQKTRPSLHRSQIFRDL